MTNPIYTPFTYLVRMEVLRPLVLPELGMPEDVTQMIYGRYISQVPNPLKRYEKSMANQM